MRKVDVAERRARLARRHRLAPGHRAADVVEAARSWSACTAPTPRPCTCRPGARRRHEPGRPRPCPLRGAVAGQAPGHAPHAVRVPPRALGFAQAGASERVAGAERRRLVSDVERAGLQHRRRALAGRGVGAGARGAGGRPRGHVVRAARGDPRCSRARSTYGEGKSWGGKAPVGPRVLTMLSAAGRIVRASNDGGWTASRPRWASMESWLGAQLEPPSEAAGVAGLVERWLRAFGPGTEADLRWWLGSTLTAVRARAGRAGGRRGRPGRRDRLPAARRPRAHRARGAVGRAAAAARPTTMGWKERDWYLGPHKAQLFDTSGNAGPTDLVGRADRRRLAPERLG